MSAGDNLRDCQHISVLTKQAIRLIYEQIDTRKAIDCRAGGLKHAERVPNIMNRRRINC